MRTVLIVPEKQINFQELKKLIEDFNGQWENDPDAGLWGGGFIERGATFISLDYTDNISQISSEEKLEEYSSLLSVNVNIGINVCTVLGDGTDESHELAIEVIKEMLKRWGGCIDFCGVPLSDHPWYYQRLSKLGYSIVNSLKD